MTNKTEIPRSYESEYIMDEPVASISLTVCQSGWQACQSGHSYGPTVRNYYVIHYILKGKGSYQVGGRTYSLGAGDGFLILPGDETFYRADTLEPWEYYWVGFQGNEAQRLLRLAGLGRANLVFTARDDDPRGYMEKIYCASKDSDSRDLAMIGYLYLFFSNLVRNSSATGPYHHLYLSRAMDYISENYSKPIAVEQLAAHIGIDRTYLYRIFKNLLDTSVKEYIDSFRLSKARDLLETSGLSATEICAEVGFADYGNFSKKFKSVFGNAPAAYRRATLPQADPHKR